MCFNTFQTLFFHPHHLLSKHCCPSSNCHLSYPIASPPPHKMHLHTVRKEFVASTRRFVFAIFFLIIGAVIIGQIIDEIVANILTVTMRRSQHFASMNVPTFHQARYPYELLIVAPITFFITIIIFIYVYVFSPALCVLPNTAFISLIRGTDFSTSSPSRVLRNNIQNSKKTLRSRWQHRITQILGMMTVEWTIQLLSVHPVHYNAR